MPKPVSYKELLAALGMLLSEYAELDEMLDVISAYPSELTREEKARQRRNNRARDKIRRLYSRALATTSESPPWAPAAEQKP